MFNGLQTVLLCLRAFPKVYHDASHAMDNLAACYGVWNVNAMPKEKTEAFI